MVGVEESVRDDLPCLVPRKLFLVNKNAHQLRNGECGVGLRISCSVKTQDDTIFLTSLS